MRSLLSLYYTDVVDRDDAYEFIITFYTDALLAALKRWLREGTMPPERFVDLVRRATTRRAAKV